MDKRLKAVIIDDEENCIANLKYFLTAFCPDIEVVAVGDTVKIAKEIFRTKKFDIAFLDIELHSDNIFDSLSVAEQAGVKVVFVTAHEQYALRAIKLQAFDYILKPLSQEEIINCCMRIRQQMKGSAVSDKLNAEQATSAERKWILKDGSHVFIVKTDDIYYMQASGAYTLAAFRLNDSQKQITISKSLNQIEREHSSPKLYRVHKSFLINVQEIKNIIRNKGVSVMMGNNKIIPIAKRRVTDFLSFLNR